MNQALIEQLADRADELADEIIQMPGEYHPHWHGVRDRKFAELIVRECLDACSRANEIRHFVPPTQEQVVLNCMREIETTFRS